MMKTLTPIIIELAQAERDQSKIICSPIFLILRILYSHYFFSLDVIKIMTSEVELIKICQVKRKLIIFSLNDNN